jgi:hypothetical protein
MIQTNEPNQIVDNAKSKEVKENGFALFCFCLFYIFGFVILYLKYPSFILIDKVHLTLPIKGIVNDVYICEDRLNICETILYNVNDTCQFKIDDCNDFDCKYDQIIKYLADKDIYSNNVLNRTVEIKIMDSINCSKYTNDYDKPDIADYIIYYVIILTAMCLMTGIIAFLIIAIICSLLIISYQQVYHCIKKCHKYIFYRNYDSVPQTEISIIQLADIEQADHIEKT